jgi:hypothetical protein
MINWTFDLETKTLFQLKLTYWSPEHLVWKLPDEVSGRRMDLRPLGVEGDEGGETDSKVFQLQRIRNSNLHSCNPIWSLSWGNLSNWLSSLTENQKSSH